LVVCDRGERGAAGELDGGVKADEKRLLALEKPLMIRTRAAATAASRDLWFRLAMGPLLLIGAALPVCALPETALAQAAAAAAAGAPSTPLPTVPNDVKSKYDITADRPAIEKFVELAVTQLATGSLEQQAKARDALRNEAYINGQATASAAYLDAYAKALNTQLLPIEQNPNIHVRTNAAIVAQAVGVAANNTQLAPVVLAFINDKAEPVVLWGIKAARWIIPSQLSVFAGQKNTALLDAIVAAVQKHPNSQAAGGIALEAYSALTLDISEHRNKATLPMQLIVAPYVQKLMEVRLQVYVHGVAPWPGAETRGSSFLSNSAIWSSLAAADQLKVMQDFCDLVGLMAQQAGPTATPGDRGDLAEAIRSIASAISVVADPTNRGPVAQAIAPATKLTSRSTSAEIAAAVNAILPAVQQVPMFKNLTAAPTIQGHEAAPAPASEPATTGPVVIPGAMPVPAPGATKAPPTPAHVPAKPGAPGAPAGGRPANPAARPANPAGNPGR